MHTHNVLYCGLIIVLSVTLLLLTAPLPGTAAPAAYLAAHPNADWREVGAGSASGGGISGSTGISGYPSVAIAPDGIPYVAWNDWSSGDWEVYVRRWNGSRWEEVGAGSASGGGISDNSGKSKNPSVAIALDGTPYVAWEDDSYEDYEIYVRRWNGSNWEEVGTGSASGGGISDNSGKSGNPSVAIALDGTPYVAWEDDSYEDDEIYVRRWNDSNWEEVGAGSASGGGISDNSDDSWAPSVAIALDGTPYVAWEDHSDDAGIYVRRWNGNRWEEVGAGSASGGGISNNDLNSYVPSMAIAPNGRPYVVWVDSRGWDWEVYVRRWNGSNWEEVGAGSASGGGISDNSGNSWAPSVAIAPDGAPYVAWEDDSYEDCEIYVRRWNDSNWEEVGAGSASGGGISDNSDDSWAPSVAIALDGTPYVAWGDYSYDAGIHVIYVRWWEEPETVYVYVPLIMKGYCGCGPDNYEPNDSCNQAYGPLTSGQTYQSYISCCDVVTYKKSDYLYVDIGTTNAINIELTDIPAGTDYDLYLYRNPGDDPDNAAAKSEGTGSSESISYAPPATGRYYIRVYGYSGSSTSPYSLRVTYD